MASTRAINPEAELLTILTFPGCFGMCCMPCQYGQTSEIIGAGGCAMQTIMMALCPTCVQCCMAPGRRGKLRQDLGALAVRPACSLCWAYDRKCHVHTFPFPF